jgi:hypothetical protein
MAVRSVSVFTGSSWKHITHIEIVCSWDSAWRPQANIFCLSMPGFNSRHQWSHQISDFLTYVFTQKRKSYPCDTLASHRGGLDSRPGSMWVFWWTKRHWGRFSPSTSVSPANHHSTNFWIIIITRGWHNRPIGGRSAEWTQLHSTPQYSNFINLIPVTGHEDP